MANKLILLCLFVVCLSTNVIECRRSGGRSGGGSHSSSRSSWGSHHSSKPSSSWSWGGSSNSRHTYPSSSSGLSGSGGSNHGYPSSSSGLSGSGSRNHGYPSSSSGLSGSGSGGYGYPSSSTGLSGSGSGRHTYPSSSTGLSGSGSGSQSGNNNPSWWFSSSSGSGSNNNKPSYGTSHPSSTSYNTNYGHSSNSYNPNPYGTSYSSGHYNHPTYRNIPTYSSSPQYVYVHEYRNSDSRYGDLLTGLALYNLGRSNSHYNHHYYYDDYYRRRYDTPSSTYQQKPTATDTATCTLRIKENGKLEVLKIPCEIVSTFTEGSKKETTTVNSTVCTTNTTTVMANSTRQILGVSDSTSTTAIPTTTLPTNTSSTTTIRSDETTLSPTSVLPINVSTFLSSTTQNVLNATIKAEIMSSTTPAPVINTTEALTVIPSDVKKNETSGSPTVSITNSTSCITTITASDPLKVKGPKLNTSNMDCSVEILTRQSRLVQNVDCKVLQEYSKMPEPKKDNSGILPERSQLKSWLQKPPWWMSMFIAV